MTRTDWDITIAATVRPDDDTESVIHQQRWRLSPFEQSVLLHDDMPGTTPSEVLSLLVMPMIDAVRDQIEAL